MSSTIRRHEAPISNWNRVVTFTPQRTVRPVTVAELQRVIREQSDAGTPPVVADPAGAAAQLYLQLARQTAVAVSRLAKDYAAKFPTITLSKTS